MRALEMVDHENAGVLRAREDELENVAAAVHGDPVRACLIGGRGNLSVVGGRGGRRDCCAGVSGREARSHDCDRAQKFLHSDATGGVATSPPITVVRTFVKFKLLASSVRASIVLPITEALQRSLANIAPLSI